jgi:hypothetical protein
MPISHSPSPRTKPTGRGLPVDRGSRSGSRSYWPLILIGVVAVLAVIIAALPASLIVRFLPPPVHAEDFSGSLWHGSAGKLSVNARDAGALEWRLHPAALFGLNLAADLHWVKVGFVVDAAVNVDRHGFTARDIKGSGPIEDLHDLGFATEWRGTAALNFREVRGDFTQPLGAIGDLKISSLSAAQVAAGADLGSYDLVFAPDSTAADGGMTATLTDAGGPLQVQALIHYSPKEHTGMLSGTVKERADAPAALHSQLQNLLQLHPADAQGRIPVDLEFRL